MRRYVIYAALALATLVMLNLLAPLVVFGSNALVHDPNLSIFNIAAPKESVPAAPVAVNAARGQAIYRTYCYGCHAMEAKFGPVVGAEFQAKYPSDAAIADAIRNGRAPMPSFPEGTLSDADLADLTTFLRALK